MNSDACSDTLSSSDLRDLKIDDAYVKIKK